MKIVNTNSAVRTASIKTPLANEVSAESVVLTLKLVGKSLSTRKEANMAPTSCAPVRSNARGTVIAFTSTIPSVT